MVFRQYWTIWKALGSLGMIHAEQGERVANFRAVIWLFSPKTSTIIFNIIHWCHCSSCWKAGGVLNDLGKGEYIQVCGTPRAGDAWLGQAPCGMRGLIAPGMMPSAGESSGTAGTETFQLLFGRKAWACREMQWDSGSTFQSQRCGSPALCGNSQGKSRAEGRAAG